MRRASTRVTLNVLITFLIDPLIPLIEEWRGKFNPNVHTARKYATDRRYNIHTRIRKRDDQINERRCDTARSPYSHAI